MLYCIDLAACIFPSGCLFVQIVDARQLCIQTAAVSQCQLHLFREGGKPDFFSARFFIGQIEIVSST
ncbi:hypothetical protein D3C76_1355140 [compost metagenome]